MPSTQEGVPITDLQREVDALASGSAAPLAAASYAQGRSERAATSAPALAARFEIGSVSKAITGALLGVLVESGDVDPDSPMDELHDADLPWAGRSPTVAELASHRSGLPNTPRRLRGREATVALGLSTRDPWRDVDEHVYQGMLRDAARRAKPSESARYSSMGIGLLGECLTHALSTDLSTLFRDRLFRPLGMMRTGFDRPTAGVDFVVPGINRRGRTLPYLHDQMPAAGMLASTVDDLTLLARAILGEGPDDVIRGLQRAVTPLAPLGKHVQVGYCWFIADEERGRVIVHNGATWASQAHISAAPERGRTAALTSATYRDLDTLGMRILNTP